MSAFFKSLRMFVVKQRRWLHHVKERLASSTEQTANSIIRNSSTTTTNPPPPPPPPPPRLQLAPPPPPIATTTSSSTAAATTTAVRSLNDCVLLIYIRKGYCCEHHLLCLIGKCHDHAREAMQISSQVNKQASVPKSR
jgi:hypothetical protein